VAATLKGESGVGTNIAGAAFTIRPGLSTGNATGGVINFQTGTTGSTGDATQSAVTRMVLAESANSTTLDLTTSMSSVNLFNGNATSAAAFASATTLTLANSGTGARAVSIATAATGGASTLTFGGAVTGNIFKINGTAAGTINLTSDVTTGTVNLYTGTTGTTNIANSGTINLGTSASATTAAVVGGAITGNSLKIAGVTSGTVNLTTDVTTGVANVFTSVTGTVNIGSATGTVEMGIVELNNQLSISSVDVSAITTITAVSSFATATHRSAKFTVQVTCTSGTDINQYQTSEILMIHDGTTATLTDYAVIRTGNNLVTFTADVSGGNARLLATATAGNTIRVRVVRYLNTI
jgi:hypothetical protein